MAIAHVCLNCGWDLARVRPFREPRYGLPLVVCPRCSKPAVRQRHPLWRHWQTVRRLDWTLSVIATQVLCIVGFTAATLPAIIGVVSTWPEMASGPRRPDTEFAWLLIFVVLAPLIGAWLTAGFSHIRLWKVWLGWMAYITLGLAIISFVLAAENEVHGVTHVRSHWQEPLGERLLMSFWLTFVPGLLVHAVMMLCAAIGIPLGRALLWLVRVMRRGLWRWRRKRWRLQRAGAA